MATPGEADCAASRETALSTAGRHAGALLPPVRRGRPAVVAPLAAAAGRGRPNAAEWDETGARGSAPLGTAPPGPTGDRQGGQAPRSSRTPRRDKTRRGGPRAGTNGGSCKPTAPRPSPRRPPRSSCGRTLRRLTATTMGAAGRGGPGQTAGMGAMAACSPGLANPGSRSMAMWAGPRAACARRIANVRGVRRAVGRRPVLSPWLPHPRTVGANSAKAPWTGTAAAAAVARRAAHARALTDGGGPPQRRAHQLQVPRRSTGAAVRTATSTALRAKEETAEAEGDPRACLPQGAPGNVGLGAPPGPVLRAGSSALFAAQAEGKAAPA